MSRRISRPAALALALFAGLVTGSVIQRVRTHLALNKLETGVAHASEAAHALAERVATRPKSGGLQLAMESATPSSPVRKNASQPIRRPRDIYDLDDDDVDRFPSADASYARAAPSPATHYCRRLAPDLRQACLDEVSALTRRLLAIVGPGGICARGIREQRKRCLTEARSIARAFALVRGCGPSCSDTAAMIETLIGPKSARTVPRPP